jgi:hypothetical protein
MAHGKVLMLQKDLEKGKMGENVMENMPKN